MHSNTGSPRFVGKTNGLCQSPLFLDQEDRGLWVRDFTWRRKKVLLGTTFYVIIRFQAQFLEAVYMGGGRDVCREGMYFIPGPGLSFRLYERRDGTLSGT